MPQDPASALSALLRSSSIQDHDEILKAASAALRANKSDFTSQHTRVVALLKLDRFDDAIRAIDEGGTKLDALCVLERAYALYKTGRLEEATAVLQASGLTKRSFNHVAAQVAYRSERFDDARNIYSRLLDSDAADEENDLGINIRAAYAQSEWLGFSSLTPPEVQDSDGFELCYNAACAYIARGSLDTASQLLQRALRLCDASEDLTDEDKRAEMAPIQAQQAFVYAKMGKLHEALELCKTLDNDTLADEPDLSLIVKNNVLVLGSQSGNPFMTQREVSALATKHTGAKLFDHQASIILRNRLVADLHASKASGVQSRTEKLLSEVEHPSTKADTNVFSVLNAAAAAKGEKGKLLLKNLQALAAKRPHDVGLVLAIVQVQLDGGHLGSALSALESFLKKLEEVGSADSLDVRFSPGIVALTVSLLRAQGRESSAKAELVKAASHWQGRPAGSAISLLEEAGVELLKSSNPKELELAGVSFQKLMDERQAPDVAPAGLVAALAPFNLPRVKQHLDQLPPAEDLIAGVDVSALLGAGIPTVARPSQAGKRAAEDQAKKPNKRRRKIRLPKDYEEGKKPDPERWLPLRDRSTYRPKGKKGKKKAGESTQGGIVREEETLELVGGGGVKVEKAPPVSSKKKKKGKK